VLEVAALELAAAFPFPVVNPPMPRAAIAAVAALVLGGVDTTGFNNSVNILSFSVALGIVSELTVTVAIESLIVI
jgi:hypothetical protein